MAAPLIVRFGDERGDPLTSRDWLSVFERFAESKPAAKPSAVKLDLSEIPWMGHLPLLAFCLLAQNIQSVYHAEDATVIMPRDKDVRAFLERWEFYTFLRSKRFSPDLEPERHLKKAAFARSCVLPILGFSRSEQASELTKELQDAQTDVHKLLRTAAFLDADGVRGLADLVIHELCKNVIEHSANGGEAFIFGRVSKPDDVVRWVYEKNAAPWEKAFFTAIEGEGMTELVLGDSGAGIVRSLRAEAERHGRKKPQEILEWSFAPFSTCKADNSEHTRGLWAVRNKIRELRGILYVRTDDGNGGGVSAWWDFLNNPDGPPQPGSDTAPFSGTQFQILLPHLTKQRPVTYISCDRAAAAVANRELRSVGFQIPPDPPPKKKPLSLAATVRDLRPNQVLFIDMARMNQETWDRVQVDAIGRAISEGVGADLRRIWLLNPKDETLERLRSSSWVVDVWRNHGILQPVVRVSDDPAVPPRVSFVIVDHSARSKEEGDTEDARRELYRLMSGGFTGDVLTRASISRLKPEERVWLTTHLAMNASSVEVLPDVEGRIVPAFDVEELARATVEALLPHTLGDKIDASFAEQDGAEQRVWFQLPSGSYCENYVDPTILGDLDPPSLNAMEKWIERQVAEFGAEYAIAYTRQARLLLARAVRGNPGIKRLVPLKHYVASEYQDLVASIRDEARVVILVSISGSGATIETILDHLAARRVIATVINFINTTSEARLQVMPRLAELERSNRFKYLVARPIQIYPEIPKGEKHRQIALIDPDTFLPVVPMGSFSSLISDGEFWSIAGRSHGLTVDPVTYKGRDYNTSFLMRNIFRSGPPGTPDRPALELVLNHLESCFEGRKGPDMIFVNRETTEALKKTDAQKRTRAHFPNVAIAAEGTPEYEEAARKLEGKYVVIFCAATYSGSAIARLLKKLETAKRIHICVFLTRIPEPMIASFTRQPKVTFSAFIRLFSASSESSVGSSRVIRLQNLADYRPSCLSQRLLLFVEEEQRDAQNSRAAQDPDTLEAIVAPLESPAPDLFRPGDSYDFQSDKGKADLADLVWRCGADDAEWVYAVLEEAANRTEIYERGADPQYRTHHLEAVGALYKAAANESVRIKVLEALLLHRWHGRQELTERGVAGFGHALLSDVVAPQSSPELRAACVRALSKVDRQQLIERLEAVVEAVRTDRHSELTLAVEMTKILDDESRWEELRSAFETVLNRRALEQRAENATDVALRCLLADIGLFQDQNGTVDFLPWDQGRVNVLQVLQSEPPDPARTIRCLIRYVRGLLGANARILYYEREANRFAYLDAWPRAEVLATRPVPERNIIAATLVENRPDFYSANVSDPSQPAYVQFYSKLQSETDRDDLRDNALFIARIGSTGLLRIFYRVLNGGEMPFVDAVQKAVTDVTDLLTRDDSQLTRIGTFQYLDTVKGFHSPAPDAGSDPLRQFLENVFALLGADIGSVMVLNPERTHWIRQDVIGGLDPGGFQMFDRTATDRVTSQAATLRTHLRFTDEAERNTKGYTHDGLVPWAPAWLALPMLQENDCRIVLNLWHHIAGWFNKKQYPDALITSLSRLGGAIVQIQAEHQKARQARRREINHLRIDVVTRHLRELTLIAEEQAFLGRNAPDGLPELAQQIAQIQQTVEDLIGIVKEEQRQGDGRAPSTEAPPS